MHKQTKLQSAMVDAVLESFRDVPEESALTENYSPEFPARMKAYVDTGVRIANLWFLWKCLLLFSIAAISIVLFLSLILNQF
jgi:hypothetical protein